jgi:type II secretory pathway component GspD/PulD (secretin)
LNVKTFAALLLAAALAGCAALDPLQRLMTPIQHDQAGRIAGERVEARDPELDSLVAHNRQKREEPSPAVMQSPARAGSGLIGEVDVNRSLPAAKPGAAAAGGAAKEVTLAFNDASLKDIVTVFMKDYLKQPFTFQDSFKDRKVNLYFKDAATREDLIRLFDTLLETYGVRLRYSDGVYLVGSSDDKAAPLQQPSPLGIGDAIGVVRLKFIEARDFLALAKQVVKYPDKLTALPGNVLVVNSTSIDVRAVRSLVEDLDVPAFSGKYILVYAPRYLSAGSLVALLEGAQGQLVGAAQAAGPKQYEAKQIPDSERLVIVAANPLARDLVLQLLAESDVADASARRVYQYNLGTQVAADILPNLNILIKSVVKSPTEVSVVADKASNSLFIHASPEEYAEISKLLARMDFRPPSVQIDMIIAEVDLTDAMQYGVEVFLHRAGSTDASANSYFGSPVRESGTNRILGFSGALVKGLDRYATLQLIGNETSFTLLSNPKIMVKNGATAKITVATEQPVIRSKTSVNVTGGATTVEPEFKKVGLELEVTPTVSSENVVRVLMKLRDTTITGSVILGTDSYPVLATRELNTDFTISDGRTVFLGGIRKQNTNDKANRVPGLGNIPGLGALFRDKTLETNGQELIILATATVILDQYGADTVTQALLRAARREFKDLRPPPAKQPAAESGADSAGKRAPG